MIARAMPVLHGLAMLLGIGLSILAEFASAAEVYPCSNLREGEASLSADWLDDLEQTEQVADPVVRERQLRKLRGRTDSALGRSLVAMQFAHLALEQGRIEDAAAQYRSLLDDPFLSRAQLDRLRAQLAALALRGGRHDEAIALLAPVFAAGCAPMPSQAYYTLADAWLAKGMGREALAVLDAAWAPAAVDRDWWRAAKMELRCKLEGPNTCIDRIVEAARAGGLGDGLRDVLDELLAMAARSPDAHATALRSAIKEGVLDAEARIVPRAPQPVAELEPIKQVAPRYPPEAARSAVSGYVLLSLIVGADGRVREVKVLDASPPGVFEEVSVQSALKSTFTPKRISGEPVETTGTYKIVFRIRSP